MMDKSNENQYYLSYIRRSESLFCYLLMFVSYVCNGANEHYFIIRITQNKNEYFRSLFHFPLIQTGYDSSNYNRKERSYKVRVIEGKRIIK